MTNFHTFPCVLALDVEPWALVDDELVAEELAEADVELEAAATVGAGLEEHRVSLVDELDEFEQPLRISGEAIPSTAKVVMLLRSVQFWNI